MKEIFSKLRKKNTTDGHRLTPIFPYRCSSLFIVLLSVVIFESHAQSLWVDRNPYANGQDIRLGSIIRVMIKDGMKGDYVYEGAKDDSFVIRSHPDKKIVDEMRGFTADRSVAHRQNGKSKSTAKIIGSMSVLVTAVDPTTGLLT